MIGTTELLALGLGVISILLTLFYQRQYKKAARLWQAYEYHTFAALDAINLQSVVIEIEIGHNRGFYDSQERGRRYKYLTEKRTLLLDELEKSKKAVLEAEKKMKLFAKKDTEEKGENQ